MEGNRKSSLGAQVQEGTGDLSGWRWEGDQGQEIARNGVRGRETQQTFWKHTLSSVLDRTAAPHFLHQRKHEGKYESRKVVQGQITDHQGLT